MSVARSLRRFLYRLINRRQGSNYGLCSPNELEQAIQRERSRADRTGGEFTVVSFYPNQGQTDRRLLLPLIKHLKQRSRSVDDMGWNQDGKLWLILANCSEQAAGNVAAEQCRQFSTKDCILAFTLYHYASNGTGKGPPGTNRARDASESAVRESAPSLQSLSLAGGELLRESFVPQMPAALVWEQGHSIETLFVRQMPWWKRTLDVTASLTALMLLAPLFAVIAVTVKLTSPGPVLFKQLRSGRGGKPFVLYKFRSMSVDAESQKKNLLAMNEQDGPAFKMERDPRVTPIGRWLRAFSFDELPQLWNVFRGDMSLVGPRPLPLDEANACLGWQRQRTDVTPGLTCFWQVKDRRAKIPFVEWARMDIRYITQHSFWTDVRLLFQTVLFVIRRKGV